MSGRGWSFIHSINYIFRLLELFAVAILKSWTVSLIHHMFVFVFELFPFFYSIFIMWIGKELIFCWDCYCIPFIDWELHHMNGRNYQSLDWEIYPFVIHLGTESCPRFSCIVISLWKGFNSQVSWEPGLHSWLETISLTQLSRDPILGSALYDWVSQGSKGESRKILETYRSLHAFGLGCWW